MNKRTLASILTVVGIAGGALAVSQVDSSRINNAFEGIASSRKKVDLGRTVSETQLKSALSNVAKDMGYNINFNKVFEKGYRLGSVEETSKYLWTEVNVSIGPTHGIEFIIYEGSTLMEIRPSGFASDEEIKQYLSGVSNYLSGQ